MSNLATVFHTAPKWTNVEAIDATDAINSAYKNAELQNKAFNQFADAGADVFNIAQQKQALEVQKAIEAMSLSELEDKTKSQAAIDQMILEKFQPLGGANATTLSAINKSLSDAYSNKLKEENDRINLDTQATSLNQAAYTLQRKKDDDAINDHGRYFYNLYDSIEGIKQQISLQQSILDNPESTEEQKAAATNTLTGLTEQYAATSMDYSALTAQLGDRVTSMLLNNSDQFRDRFTTQDMTTKAEGVGALDKAYKERIKQGGSIIANVLLDNNVSDDNKLTKVLESLSGYGKLPPEVFTNMVGSALEIVREQTNIDNDLKAKIEMAAKQLQYNYDRLNETKRHNLVNEGQEQQKINLNKQQHELDVLKFATSEERKSNEAVSKDLKDLGIVTNGTIDPSRLGNAIQVTFQAIDRGDTLKSDVFKANTLTELVANTNIKGKDWTPDTTETLVNHIEAYGQKKKLSEVEKMMMFHLIASGEYSQNVPKYRSPEEYLKNLHSKAKDSIRRSVVSQKDNFLSGLSTKLSKGGFSTQDGRVATALAGMGYTTDKLNLTGVNPHLAAQFMANPNGSIGNNVPYRDSYPAQNRVGDLNYDRGKLVSGYGMFSSR